MTTLKKTYQEKRIVNLTSITKQFKLRMSSNYLRFNVPYKIRVKHKKRSILMKNMRSLILLPHAWNKPVPNNSTSE